MSAWAGVFQYRIPWETMLEDYAWLAAFGASLLVVAVSVFHARDFKN